MTERDLLSDQTERKATVRTVKPGLDVVEWVPEGRRWRVARSGEVVLRESVLPPLKEREGEQKEVTLPALNHLHHHRAS